MSNIHRVGGNITIKKTPARKKSHRCLPLIIKMNFSYSIMSLNKAD